MASDSDDDRPGPWAITEQPVALPDAVAGSDPAAAYRALMVSRGELENRRHAEGRAAHQALEGLLTDLIGVLDALDRAVTAAEERGDGSVSSLNSTRRRLRRVLRGQGVDRVEQVGAPLDPDVADIEDVDDGSELAAETVLSETVAAYTWRGTTLRRGAVIVSSGTTTAGRTTSAPRT